MIREIIELQEKVDVLQRENRRLRERENDSMSVLRILIQKLPTPAVALDDHLRVMYTNKGFVELLNWQVRAQIEEQKHEGFELREIVSQPVFELIQGTHLSGEDAIRAELRLPDGDFWISVYSIRRGELTIAIVSNMNNPQVRTTEVVSRLEQTIERNMSMIQQIASLLGEEVSQNAMELNAIIKTIQYPDQE